MVSREEDLCAAGYLCEVEANEDGCNTTRRVLRVLEQLLVDVMKARTMIKSPVCIRQADQVLTLCGEISAKQSTVSFVHAVEHADHLESLVTCARCWAIFVDWRELKKILKIDDLT